MNSKQTERENPSGLFTGQMIPSSIADVRETGQWPEQPFPLQSSLPNFAPASGYRHRPAMTNVIQGSLYL
jgi:hypothetical protein